MNTVTTLLSCWSIEAYDTLQPPSALGEVLTAFCKVCSLLFLEHSQKSQQAQKPFSLALLALMAFLASVLSVLMTFIQQEYSTGCGFLLLASVLFLALKKASEALKGQQLAAGWKKEVWLIIKNVTILSAVEVLRYHSNSNVAIALGVFVDATKDLEDYPNLHLAFDWIAASIATAIMLCNLSGPVPQVVECVVLCLLCIIGAVGNTWIAAREAYLFWMAFLQRSYLPYLCV